MNQNIIINILIYDDNMNIMIIINNTIDFESHIDIYIELKVNNKYIRMKNHNHNYIDNIINNHKVIKILTNTNSNSVTVILIVIVIVILILILY